MDLRENSVMAKLIKEGKRQSGGVSRVRLDAAQLAKGLIIVLGQRARLKDLLSPLPALLSATSRLCLPRRGSS